ncbi:peptidase T [bacterium]|nr:peptidase T [bacterium]
MRLATLILRCLTRLRTLVRRQIQVCHFRKIGPNHSDKAGPNSSVIRGSSHETSCSLSGADVPASDIRRTVSPRDQASPSNEPRRGDICVARDVNPVKRDHRPHEPRRGDICVARDVNPVKRDLQPPEPRTATVFRYAPPPQTHHLTPSHSTPSKPRPDGLDEGAPDLPVGVDVSRRKDRENIRPLRPKPVVHDSEGEPVPPEFLDRYGRLKRPDTKHRRRYPKGRGPGGPGGGWNKGLRFTRPKPAALVYPDLIFRRKDGYFSARAGFVRKSRSACHPGLDPGSSDVAEKSSPEPLTPGSVEKHPFGQPDPDLRVHRYAIAKNPGENAKGGRKLLVPIGAPVPLLRAAASDRIGEGSNPTPKRQAFVSSGKIHEPRLRPGKTMGCELQDEVLCSGTPMSSQPAHTPSRQASPPCSHPARSLPSTASTRAKPIGRDTMINDEIRTFFTDTAKENFLRYVQVHTTSDEENENTPSTERQWDLLRMLEGELQELGMDDVHISEYGYVYAILPPSEGAENAPAFGLLAHVDTSPDQPGDNVKPRIIENYDGGTITFPEDPELKLGPDNAPEIVDFKGDDIITASGRTLLGADDKGGVAEIMAAMATFKKFPELKHGEIRVCFTPDEEIGRGTVKIDEEWLPKFCYTLDGGYVGELEGECFDAWRADIAFKGIGVHPGFAKDKMINAIATAARFVAALPEWQTPEHTELREGFFHVVGMEGDFENAKATMIIRDFEEPLNKKRMELLESMKETFEKRYPGLEIDLQFKHQYKNMRDIVNETPEVMDIAERAMEAAGVTVLRKSIRGGTDGSRLTQLGHPTPNLFAGGLHFHSRLEYLPLSSMSKAVETVLQLARLWAQK